MNKIKRFFKQLLCRHKNTDLTGYIVYPTPTKQGNILMAEYYCKKCEKIFYRKA